MRKQQKEDVLNIIKDMHKAQENVKRAIDAGSLSNAQNMMCDLQETAIAFGELVDSIEGEGTSTVGLLQEYCELLYTSLMAVQEGRSSGEDIFRALERSVNEIEETVRKDIPEKKEMVFFPYKASMWDSLEGLYLKLKEDPNNDVYCVPIPYYDVLPDGNLGTLHYEGAGYPKNIEVMDFRKYDFENRRPDEIYIHNPYDDINAVTRVPSRFYSKNLKKYTDKLVYSPYFLGPEIADESNQAAVERMKFYCWVPGVFYADEVILQSEVYKRIYIRHYAEIAQSLGFGGKHTDPDCLDKKFKAVGSPKIEKVLRTKKEDQELPEEWLRLIKKPDGSWKKIVFYNVSIASLLKFKEEWVDKIEDTLKVFEGRKDDIVLLWRPHPLVENTMLTMRPEMREKYILLRDQYVSEGWGIYDDTTDLNRAIAISDAYYGDLSSVVNLFQAVKKPVMIQNVKV